MTTAPVSSKPGVRVLLFVAAALTILGCFGSLSYAEEIVGYRNVPLGASLDAVSTATGVPVASAKTVHLRPVLMQTLEWRPRPVAGAIDPVQTVTYRFYDNRLYAVTVDYEARRTAGLTESDLIDAIGQTYGLTAPRMVKPERPNAPDAMFAPRSIARWVEPAYSITLQQTKSPTAFRMLMESTDLAALAHQADTEASRLDTMEAPDRERARVKQEQDTEASQLENSRRLNKPAFTP